VVKQVKATGAKLIMVSNQKASPKRQKDAMNIDEAELAVKYVLDKGPREEQINYS